MSLRSLLPFGREMLPTRSDGDPFAVLRRDLDRLFDGMMTSSLVPLWSDHMAPRIDVRETDTGLDITAELPGVEEKDVEITLDDGALTIRGEKKMETEKTEEGAKGWRMSERAYGSFLRTVALPFEVDDKGVKATFENGVLKVALPRSAKAKEHTRKIPVTHH
jgi:HSP20 family protein